ncbi:MAG: hypothetical protein AAF367_20490 [Pseudomonadota bacterium]
MTGLQSNANGAVHALNTAIEQARFALITCSAILAAVLYRSDRVFLEGSLIEKQALTFGIFLLVLGAVISGGRVSQLRHALIEFHLDSLPSSHRVSRLVNLIVAPHRSSKHRGRLGRIESWLFDQLNIWSIVFGVFFSGAAIASAYGFEVTATLFRLLSMVVN